ncbi:transporter [Pullulanibacillus camelliae]|uniref:Transporter n=1 Tax=Pullulanibacillus camelliae TaxID=1707096 RepID=A0A8J2VP96_9BACL|nr:EamA family transporter [Pullulanibacillus camelliae]GGE34136.1 transporter [Pullulanibacillus camelliae]
MGYIYILGTIAFTVYGQLVLKWRMNRVDTLPPGLLEKLFILFKMIMDPFVFSGLAAAFLASLFWMAAMTKFELSYAYPFMSLSFLAVFILSIVLFHEALTWQKGIGLACVILGIAISSQGA